MSEPHRILFVCHSNICRSPMAQFVMEDLVRAAGREDEFVIDSAATTDHGLRQPPHPGTRAVLERHGVPMHHHRARRLRPADYDDWDLIIYMDDENLWGLRRIFPRDPESKLRPLLEFAPASYAHGRLEVDDPWYTGNYDATYADVVAGCKGLLQRLIGGDA